MSTKYCCKKFKEAKKRGEIKSFLCFHTRTWSDKFDISLNECPYCNHHFQYQKGGKMSENMFEFKGKVSFDLEFESDLSVNDLIDSIIYNIKEDLGYLGGLKNIKVTIKKGKPVDDNRVG